MRNAFEKLTMLALAALLAAGLSACGRKGNLEAPGAYESQSTQSEAEKQEKPVDNQRFFLDFLL